MTPKLLQLYSLRAQVEALIALEQSEQAVEVGCQHPEDKRRAINNMGEEPAFLCLDCGRTVKGQV